MTEQPDTKKTSPLSRMGPARLAGFLSGVAWTRGTQTRFRPSRRSAPLLADDEARRAVEGATHREGELA